MGHKSNVKVEMALFRYQEANLSIYMADELVKLKA
jgi:hypothetical protein